MIPRRHDSMLILLLYNTIIATSFFLVLDHRFLDHRFLDHRFKNYVDRLHVNDSDLSGS
jgi:hypothetical protein